MRAILLLACVLAAGCNPQFSPDPSPVHHDDGECERAEVHLRELGCVTEAKTGGGFGAFCNRMAAKAVDMHPACVSRITGCSQFNDASRGC